MKTYHAILATPCASLGIITDKQHLLGVEFLPIDTPALAPQNDIAAETVKQLTHYLANPRFVFKLPLQLNGTVHQQKVWRTMIDIPVGQTLTYGEVAKQIGSAPRAIGNACAANPIPIIVPCHRIVGKQGLGGFMSYTGGQPLVIKQWLLTHERG